MASSKLVCDVALSSVTRATDICAPFDSTPWCSFYPEAQKLNYLGQEEVGESLELLNQHGVRGRLVRAAGGLYRDRYRVGPAPWGGERGRGHVARGAEP